MTPRERLFRPYCATCGDQRVVEDSKRHTTRPCPDCGPRQERDGVIFGRYESQADYLTWKERKQLEREAPTVEIMDLTEEEARQYMELRRTHSATDKRIVLLWIEGRRYDVRKDEAWLAEMGLDARGDRVSV